jgi:hypothetical protein
MATGYSKQNKTKSIAAAGTVCLLYFGAKISPVNLMCASHATKALARELAAECLKESRYQADPARAVRLVPLRKVLLVKQVQRLVGLTAREGAVLPVASQLSL